MTLVECKNMLKSLDELNFQLPNGTLVPAHFHITEVGVITRDFIDCGGKWRTEKKVNFQLWYSDDYNHRLSPNTLLGIILKSEALLDMSDDFFVEIEYQLETIGKYTLGFEQDRFMLLHTETACLAEDACGIPSVKESRNLRNLATPVQSSGCTPGGSCC